VPAGAGRAGSGPAGLCRGARGVLGTRGWGDCLCIPAAAPKLRRDARGGSKIGEGGILPACTPGRKTGAGFPSGKLKPRGRGAGPGAAGAESPAPAPHGLGAFPQLGARGAGFSQPVRLSRLQSCPVMASRPVPPPWAAVSGLWQTPEATSSPWGAAGEHGLGAPLPARPSSGGLWRCPQPTCHLPPATGDLSHGRMGAGLGSGGTGVSAEAGRAQHPLKAELSPAAPGRGSATFAFVLVQLVPGTRRGRRATGRPARTHRERGKRCETPPNPPPGAACGARGPRIHFAALSPCSRIPEIPALSRRPRPARQD